MEFPHSGYVLRVHIKKSYFSSPYPQHQFLLVITSSYPKSFMLWVLSLLDFWYSISIFFHICSFSIKKLRYLPWLSRLLPWVKKTTSLRFYTNSIFPLRNMVGWTFPLILKLELSWYLLWSMKCKRMVHIYNEILLSHKKEGNHTICSYMDGPRGYHTEWSKSDRERQISYDTVYR